MANRKTAETMLREYLAEIKPLADADWHFGTRYMDGLKLLHAIEKHKGETRDRRYDFDTGEAARRWDARTAPGDETPETRAHELAAAVRALIDDSRPNA